MAVTDGHGHGPSPAEDVSVRGVILFTVGLVVVTTIVVALMVPLFWYFESREAAADPPPSPLGAVDVIRLPPEPRLQTSPYDDLRRFRRAEEARTSSYGWIDEEAGIVRIPVERAMDLIAERGLPVRDTSNGQP